MPRSILLSFLIWLCVLVANPNQAFAACPPNSEPYAETTQGNVRTVKCRCITGFVRRGDQCMPEGAHYERFPPPPSPYQFSGHGLIGGVSWATYPYAFSVSPNMPPEREQEVRREADRRLHAAMDHAG